MEINYFWFLPEPLFLPPPVSLLTVAQARASAVLILPPFFLVARFDVRVLTFLFVSVTGFVALRHGYSCRVK